MVYIYIYIFYNSDSICKFYSEYDKISVKPTHHENNLLACPSVVYNICVGKEPQTLYNNTSIK